MNEQRCEACRFYRKRRLPYGELSHGGGNTFPAVTGYCFRFPPVLISFEERMGSAPGDHWCGEYQPANPETVSEGAATMARLVLLGDMTAARALADKLREGE